MNTLILAITLTIAAPPPNTIVVCPPAFEDTLQPWLEYRRSQAHVIAVVSNYGTAADIRARIREHAASGYLRHVLLIGDAPIPSRKLFSVPLLAASSVPQTSASDTKHCVPTHYMAAKITLQWGGESLIASDNYYADLDDDQSPDLAIGRLTADSSAELSSMIEKIIAYEQNNDCGPWRTRINFIAGAGGFGRLADKFLERVAGNVIAQHVPATYEPTMTYACWQSPFCPDPRRFQATAIERLNEGGAFWVYIGHGHQRTLAGMSLSPGFRWDSIFSASDAPRIKPAGGPPIALFLACNTGAFDRREDCLAEELLRARSGPVAVIGASRVTMPYAMTVLGLGMMTETFQNRRATIGEVLLHAKRRLRPPASARLVGLATVVSVSKAFEMLPADLMPITKRGALLRLIRLVGTLPADLMQERAEHVALFNLFGDPLLRLRHPTPIELTVPRQVTAGDGILIGGRVKPPAHSVAQRELPLARVEIVLPRDRIAREQHPCRMFDASDAALAAYDATYRQANDGVVAAASAPIRNGQFHATIHLPADSSGRYYVRAVIESPSCFAAGASEIEIEPPTSPRPSRVPANTARVSSPAR